jgi:hypothetical protein
MDSFVQDEISHSHGMLFNPGVLNPNSSLAGGSRLNIYLGGRAAHLCHFGQYSAESATRCSGVKYICIEVCFSSVFAVRVTCFMARIC